MSGLLYPKPEPRVFAKKERRRQKGAEWAAVCHRVDSRDKHHCRACGRRCDPNAIGLLERAHRHHIIYRSAGGPDESWNIVELCSSCHASQHNGVIDIRGNADEGIEVWRNGPEGWYLSARELAPRVFEKD